MLQDDVQQACDLACGLRLAGQVPLSQSIALRAAAYCSWVPIASATAVGPRAVVLAVSLPLSEAIRASCAAGQGRRPDPDNGTTGSPGLLPVTVMP